MGASNKICPNCRRKMKQQFIGLQHCHCGMSWKKDIGFFEEGREKGQTASCYPKELNRNSTKKEGRAIAKNGSPFSIIQIAAYSIVEALLEPLTRFPPAAHASPQFAAQQPYPPD